MTDEQLNIAICEWRGYYQINPPFGWLPPDSIGDLPIMVHLPSHITGIEALGNMHEAEKGLIAQQLHEFNCALDRVITQDDKDAHWSPSRTPESYKWHATAHQRAIALLRVVKPELFHNQP